MIHPSLTLVLLCLVPFAVHSADLGITKGEKLSSAREKLLSQGWMPRETFGISTDGERWSQFGDAGELYRAGIFEVEVCSGTGLNFCSFNYVRKGRCLSLHTQGEFKAGSYEPTVIRTEKRCPSADTIKPAEKLSRTVRDRNESTGV